MIDLYKKIPRVYVAGAYSADNVMGVLNNMRRGMELATKVLLAGFAPFCPWYDYHYIILLREGENLTVQDMYTYSINWLSVSDAVLLVPGWEKSVGTKMEIEVAVSLGIPVFEDLHDMIVWFGKEIGVKVGS